MEEQIEYRKFLAKGENMTEQKTNPYKEMATDILIKSLEMVLMATKGQKRLNTPEMDMCIEVITESLNYLRSLEETD